MQGAHEAMYSRYFIQASNFAMGMMLLGYLCLASVVSSTSLLSDKFRSSPLHLAYSRLLHNRL